MTLKEKEQQALTMFNEMAELHKKGCKEFIDKYYELREINEEIRIAKMRKEMYGNGDCSMYGYQVKKKGAKRPQKELM